MSEYQKLVKVTFEFYYESEGDESESDLEQRIRNDVNTGTFNGSDCAEIIIEDAY